MKLYRDAFKAMGSPCELQAWARSKSAARQWFSIARAEANRIEKKYSRYLDTSVLSAINRSAGGAPMALDTETCDLLNYANACFTASAGRFDISSGVLRRAWDFNATTPRLPTQSEIDALLARVGWQRAQWDAPRLGLPFGMEIDFGGIGKEYAADRAATLCAAGGAEAMLINFGGDIRVTGPQHAGEPWHLGIVHPRPMHANQTIATLEITSGGIATSGDYERFFELDGQRFCHILDARTGWPVQAIQSVSVAAPACMVAGSLCTIAMLLSEHAASVLTASGFAYVMADAAGTIHVGQARP